MTSHVMVDIECLGTVPGSVILSIGAVYFGDDGLGVEFYRTIDVFDSLMQGLTIDPQTVAWWRQQSPTARAAAMAPEALRTLGGALADFARFLKPETPLWAKGPDFDLVLLGAAYRVIGEHPPWSFRHARDVRTALAMAQGVGFAGREDKHHALADAKYQAEQVRLVYQHFDLKLDEP